MSDTKKRLTFTNADVRIYNDPTVIDQMQVPVYPDMGIENKIATMVHLSRRAALMEESKGTNIIASFKANIEDIDYEFKYVSLNNVALISITENIPDEEKETITYLISGAHFLNVKDYIRFYWCDENDSLQTLKCLVEIDHGNPVKTGERVIGICRNLAKMHPSPYHSAHISSNELYHKKSTEKFTIDWFMRDGIEEASYDIPYHTESHFFKENDDLKLRSYRLGNDVTLDYVCHVDDSPLEDTSYNYTCSIEKEGFIHDIFVSSFDKAKENLSKIKDKFKDKKIYFLATHTVERYSTTHPNVKAHWWAKIADDPTSGKTFEVEINVYAQTDLI